LSPSESCTWFARLAVQAAEALEHAHQLGVVHRDVKPANLLVDVRGNLWITDFGLAHFQNDTRLTMTGDVVGTLRYMSPEQALARREGVDHRTDVYSLGATLYEMLTLKHAFDGRTRQELLRQIALDEPRPLRRVNQAVPAELETIVHKAMAKAPAERYATAQEMADDLRRFLEDRPIYARRPTLWQRTRKWGRRHRAIVVTASVGLLVAMAVLAACLGWIVRDRNVRQEKIEDQVNIALVETGRFREQALELTNDLPRWEAMLAAADSAYKRAAALADQEGGKLGAALLERLHSMQVQLDADKKDCGFFAQFERLQLEQDHADMKKDDSQARAALSQLRDALHAYGLEVGTMPAKEAIALIQQRPRPIQNRLVVALAYWHREAPEQAHGEKKWLHGVVQTLHLTPMQHKLYEAANAGDWPTLEKLVRNIDFAGQPPGLSRLMWVPQTQRSIRLLVLRRIQAAHPGDFAANNGLALELFEGPARDRRESIQFFTAAVALRPRNALAYLNLGVALESNGDGDLAMAAFQQAIALAPDLASAHFAVADALNTRGDFDGAIAAFRRAIALDPRPAHRHYRMAVCLRIKGDFQGALASFRQALFLDPTLLQAGEGQIRVLRQERRSDEAIASFQRAVRMDPNNPVPNYCLGLALNDKEQREEAVSAIRKAIDLWERQAADRDRLALIRRHEALAHFRLAEILNAARRFKEAEQACSRSLAIGAKFMAGTSVSPDLIRNHTRTQLFLGRLLESTGRLGEAEQSYRRALATADRLLDDYGGWPEDHWRQAESHYSLASILMQTGRSPEAEPLLRRALASQERILARGGGAWLDDRWCQARTQYSLGILLENTKRGKEAEQAYRQALAIQEKLQNEVPVTPNDRQVLAQTHGSLGLLLNNTQRFDEALQTHRAALAIQEKLVAEDPADPSFHRHLGATLNNISTILKKRKEWARARSLLERAIHHQRIALKAEPWHKTCRMYLNNHYRNLTSLLIQQGDHAELARRAEDWPRDLTESWQQCHFAAARMLDCRSLAEKDARLELPQRRALAGSYTDRTRVLLQEAIRRGAPGIKGALEAETLSVVDAKGCTPALQIMLPWGFERWSNGYQLFCAAQKAGHVELEIKVPATGRYKLAVHFTRAPNYGIIQVALDGATVGKPFDSFDRAVNPSGAVELATVELTAGKHRVRFTAVDKNPQSGNYNMGIDCLILTPIASGRR
jgi:tetratricopeptide (TPR) repeat protein